MTTPWANPETRAIYLEVAAEWNSDGHREIAGEWIDMCGKDAGDCLAVQLEKDFWGQHSNCGDKLINTFCRRGLRRVNWRQVAGRLLEPAYHSGEV